MEDLLSDEGQAKSHASRSKIEQVMVILVYAPSLMSLYPSPVTPLSSLFLSVYSSNTSSKIEWVLLNFIFYCAALLQVCDQPTCRAWRKVILCQRKEEASEAILISQLTLPSPVRKFRGVRLNSLIH